MGFFHWGHREVMAGKEFLDGGPEVTVAVITNPRNDVFKLVETLVDGSSENFDIGEFFSD